MENSCINILYFLLNILQLFSFLKYKVYDLAKSLIHFLAKKQLFFVTVVIFVISL